MYWIWIWLGVLVVSLIVEFSTMELVSVWLSAGSLISLILAACKVPYEIQIIVFVVASVALIVGLRPITMRVINKKTIKTNADELIGKRVKLLTDITEDDMGCVKLNGVVWNVKTENGEILKKLINEQLISWFF